VRWHQGQLLFEVTAETRCSPLCCRPTPANVGSLSRRSGLHRHTSTFRRLSGLVRSNQGPSEAWLFYACGSSRA